MKILTLKHGLIAALIGVLGGYMALAPAQDKQVTLSESELEALIDARVAERLEALKLDEAGMTARIEQGILAFIARQRARNDPSAKAKNVRPVSLEDDHIRGDPAAPVSLIEYSDFECPFCKRFHPTAQRIIDEYPGKVNWAYRHFPLEFHNPGAQKQAEASECAGELGGSESFWLYTDLIYKRTRSNGKGFPIDNLVPLAVEIGIDRKAFAECLDSGRFTEHVQRDYREGAEAGVTGTPGNILRHNVTGKVIAVMGAQPYERLKEAVEQLLKEADPG